MYANLENLQMFEKYFVRNSKYESGEIEDFLKSLNLHNPSAYSYNRWNKGMVSVFPLFEWLERGKFKYLGPHNNFNGPILHFPQNKKGLEFEIGYWIDGVFEIYNFQNFKDWRENNEDDGVLRASLNTNIEYGNEKISQRIILTDNENLISQYNGEFKYILISSRLGGLLNGKRLGETFVFGDNEYTINNITL